MTLSEPGSAGYTRLRGHCSSRHGLNLTPPFALRTSTASLSIAALLLSLLLAPAAHGDVGLGNSDFDTQPKSAAYLSHTALPQGGSGMLLAVLTIPDEFHIQKNDFLEVTVQEDAPIKLGPLDAPMNATWDGEAVLKGISALKARFVVKENAPIGLATFTVVIGYQGCSEGPIYACYPPDEAEIALTLEVLEPSVAPRLSHPEIFAAHGISIASSGSTPTSPGGGSAISEGMSLEARVKDALARGSFVAFLLIFLGGVLASLTPCVFPMIPITISYVGGRARSRMHGFTLSLIFVLGLALMYAVLGLAATATGGVFGAAMQSPIAMVIVAVIFAAMGASMLGLFDLVV
ncbi:MAG: hypothetical protein KAY24_14260, partial [Candidatus Eisenbacteria sp.]|nr:hypothetical protein [Candidatus Eisenbacteria bacterium]